MTRQGKQRLLKITCICNNSCHSFTRQWWKTSDASLPRLDRCLSYLFTCKVHLFFTFQESEERKRSDFKLQSSGLARAYMHESQDMSRTKKGVSRSLALATKSKTEALPCLSLVFYAFPLLSLLPQLHCLLSFVNSVYICLCFCASFTCRSFSR